MKFLRLCAAGVLAIPRVAIAEGETPAEIAAQLARDSRQVRQLLELYPDLPESWSESWWADALLRGRSIPGTPWRSHDLRRPQPPLAEAGRLCVVMPHLRPRAPGCFSMVKTCPSGQAP